MFISFPMYIGLIIITIFMIGLIIYLSLTGDPKNKKETEKSDTSNGEIPTTSETPPPAIQQENKIGPVNQPDALSIIPYPKEDTSVE